MKITRAYLRNFPKVPDLTGTRARQSGKPARRPEFSTGRGISHCHCHGHNFSHALCEIPQRATWIARLGATTVENAAGGHPLDHASLTMVNALGQQESEEACRLSQHERFSL